MFIDNNSDARIESDFMNCFLLFWRKLREIKLAQQQGISEKNISMETIPNRNWS